MVIEFIGLPGSGKTTLRKRVFERLAQHKSILSPQTVRKRYLGHGRWWSKLATYLTTLMTHPRFFVFGVYNIWRGSRPASDKFFATKQFGVTLVTYTYLSKYTSPSEWLVFEEGIVQRAFMTMVDAKSKIPPRAVRYYASAMPKPDILIYLKVCPRIAAERAQKRQSGITLRLQGLTIDQLMGVMQKAKDMFDTLIDCLNVEDADCVEVFEINTDDLYLAASELDQWIDTKIPNKAIQVQDLSWT